MAITLFFRIVFRKFSEIAKSKPIFSQYNFFCNYEYFFLQYAFWSLFNHRQRSKLNQKQFSMCCCSPCFIALLCTHYGLLQCFSTWFCTLKEIGVLRPVVTMAWFLVEWQRPSMNFFAYIFHWSGLDFHNFFFFRTFLKKEFFFVCGYCKLQKFNKKESRQKQTCLQVSLIQSFIDFHRC